MKKILFLLAVGLPLVFASCSKDDDKKLSLSTNRVSLYFEEMENVTASEPSTWSVENKFIATVNNGLITAQHVGNTTVTATANGQTSNCNVEVKAKYHTFTEPILEFGASKSTIKSKEKRGLLREEETSLLFKPDKSTIQSVAYIFENGKMETAGVFIKTSSSLEATSFLIERYLVIGSGSGDIVGLMLNELPSKATMSIAMSIESSYVLVAYMPYNKDKTRSIEDNKIIINKMKELYKNAE